MALIGQMWDFVMPTVMYDSTHLFLIGVGVGITKSTATS
jgi:hypothetical protein